MTDTAQEYFQTSRKIGRGRAQKSIALIEAMSEIAEACGPITGRGVGYKLFSRQLIPNMSTNSMAGVYRLLKEAREEGLVDWDLIVDETRRLEQVATWDNPEDFLHSFDTSYRRDFWNDQPLRVEVWSEKGTVRGVLQPVLDEYGVGFRVHHGFSSATTVHDVAEGEDLIALYVGDFDPSGMFMSERDLPDRLERYGSADIQLERVAILKEQTPGVIGFPASDKTNDKRHGWFVKNYGHECWELDALDPRILREIVKAKIEEHIDQEAWKRCLKVNAAEQESLHTVLGNWNRKPFWPVSMRGRKRRPRP